MNPIEVRITDLQTRWESFLETDKACLRWLAEPNEVNVVDGFVELQAEEHEYHAGDIFFPFLFAYETDQQFVDELLEEMEIAVDVARKELAEEAFGIEQWSRVDQGRYGNGRGEKEEKTAREQFSESVVSFTQNLSENLRYLVLYFHAAEVASPEQYIRFLSEVVDQLPANVKLLLLDRATDPMAPGFDNDERIESETLALDMKQAYREIVQGGGAGGAEYEFRNMLVLANEHAAEGYTPEFVSVIDKLLAITKQENWLQQSIAIHMLAAGVAVSSSVEETYNHYTKAIRVAAQLTEQEDSLAPLLTYQTQMAFGGAILSQKKPDLALALDKFRHAADASQECDEMTRGLYQMEAWRMIGYVHQLSKNPEGSWEALWKAHAAAELLPDEVKPVDTMLPEVGKMLVSLTQERNGWFSGAPYAEHHGEVMDAFNAALGEGWLEQGSA